MAGESCTEDEFKRLWCELGTTGAADHLGISQRSVRSRKARIEKRTGVPLKGEVMEGHHIKGKSTLRDLDGNIVMEWTKTSANAEDLALIQAEIIYSLKDEISPIKATKKPQSTRDSLITLYPVGDHHFGMLAWGEETGSKDYDLAIAEDLLIRSTDYLVEGAPNSSEAAILLLGDFMHYDSFQPVTPLHKNLLDADGRCPKMVRAAVKTIRFLIKCALEKHENIRLVIEIGNHDISGSIWLMEAFNMFYESEPRVTVDTSPQHFHCFTFGSNMVGTHHGHSVKLNALPLLFATDWPEEWGSSKYRTIHTGHIHQDQVKESPGITVESHGVLAPGDAYSANHGYRSRQSMKAIVLHKQHGEVARYTVNPEMLE